MPAGRKTPVRAGVPNKGPAEVAPGAGGGRAAGGPKVRDPRAPRGRPPRQRQPRVPGEMGMEGVVVAGARGMNGCSW